MSGTLSISSQPNIGTHVELRFPESTLQSSQLGATALRA
jgi:hypothetical protein